VGKGDLPVHFSVERIGEIHKSVPLGMVSGSAGRDRDTAYILILEDSAL